MQAVDLYERFFADIERIIDQTLFIRQGRLILNQETDALREEYGKSLEGIFKEVYA